GGGEWSERFFFLSGHFLRYKKRSLNLTSVNLKQTDHVEFNLQSAVVETLEETEDHQSDAGFRPRRKHVFRLVAHEKSMTRMPHGENQGGGATGGGGSGAEDGEDTEHGGGRGNLPGGGVDLPVVDESPTRRKVWVLAAMSEQERAMWMQAIREAISVGEELLSPGEAGRKADLVDLAARMSEDIEVRDRRYRLRVYRSCFVGEDAVSWLQSECGPCSVEEALSTGNKMVAASLIYHSTYGHGLENTRLFYKFADSVLEASRERRSSGTLPSWERRGRSRGQSGIFPIRTLSAGDTGIAFPVDAKELASGKQRRTGGVAAAEGQDQDYEDPDLEPVANGDDGVDSAGDSLTSVSVGSGNGSGSVSAGSRGEDNGVIDTVSNCQVAAAAAPGAGDLKGGSGRALSGGGTARNVSVRKLSREIEELKLTCAELERSQLGAERQTLAYASGFIACLEESMDCAFASIIAVALMTTLSLAPNSTQFTKGLVKYVSGRGYFSVVPSQNGDRFATSPTSPIVERLGVLLAITVGFSLYSYTRAHKAVQALRQAAAAAEASTTLTPTSTRKVDNRYVPLLHPGQAKKTLLLPRLRQSPQALAATTSAAAAAASAAAGAPLVRVASNRPIETDSLREMDDRHELDGRRLGEGAEGPTSHGVLISDGAQAGGGDDEYGARRDASLDGGVERLTGPAGTISDVESLPPEQEWPHHPIFVRLSPSVHGQVRLDGHGPQSSIPVNTDDMAVPFETPLFKGRLLMRVKGLTSGVPDQGHGAQAYFRGKKRLVQCAVQGCFKKEMPFDRAYTGQAFQRPFTKVPAKWLVRSAFAVIRRLSPALREDITGDLPYMVSPLAATSQSIRAEEPGDECAIVGDLDEETALLGGSFIERRVPASARKKFFSNPRNLKAYSFKPGVVYTFDFYQHLYDAVTFEVDLGFRKIKLADYLNQQPAQIMALDFETKEMLWNIEIWHAALLKNLES
ncbi:unnamed protein product, partial [Ascophyllum nodosum]